MSPVFKLAPLGAVDRIAFSKAAISVEDVLAVIDNEPAVPDGMFEYFEDQANLIMELKNILRERGSDEYKCKHPDKSDFLGQFVNFCTGLWTIPDSCHGVSVVCQFLGARMVMTDALRLRRWNRISRLLSSSRNSC